MGKMRNIVITGLPRSGTTLTCHLLHKLNDTVALHEPMAVNRFIGMSMDEICDSIESYFSNTRISLHERGVAVSNHVAGAVPDNTFGEARNAEGYRVFREKKSLGEIEISKPLSDDFMLCIKHNGVFAYLLEHLVSRFSCYAIVRNPVSVMASWNSVNLPVKDGHIPAAEAIDPELKESLAAIDDKHERQIYILSWFFRHFRASLSDSSILRYEDIVASGGSALAVVNPDAAELSEPLQSKNLSDLYDASLMRDLASRLLETDGDYWHFYRREEIADLV